MDRVEAVKRLSGIGIAAAILEDFPEVSDDVSSLMVYGSQARGDAVPGSDLDIIAIVPASRATINSGEVSVSFYTLEQLATGVSSLFGAHLKRDSKIIWDPSGELCQVIEDMGEVDTDRVIHRASRMSVLFTNPDHDLPKYLPGLLRQARYLLRSCLYAQAIASGAPCFSVRELALRHEDSDLAGLLASRQAVPPSLEDYAACLSRLRLIVGEFPKSEDGSLEATLVNEWGRQSDLLSMAFMSLGTSGKGSDYAEVQKILL
jgi:predicted nucleotidyltransferase